MPIDLDDIPESARLPADPGGSLVLDYDEAADILTVNGVKYSGCFFRTLAWPRSDHVFRFHREGDQVVVTDMGEAFPTTGERGH